MRILVVAALFVSAILPGTALMSHQPARLIAIADIHGAYVEFTTILRRTGLVDDQLKWSGGRATLVQTGDYMDRGADVRKVIDLLMRLEREAKDAGGQVVTLLGNHEVMNVVGEWDPRYITPEIYATFATPQSEKRREDAWKQYERLRQPDNTTAQIPPLFATSREQWMQAHPPGSLEYREALSPNGLYGKWLREKNIAAQIGDLLFMHAGINPSRPPPQSVAEVNEQARAEIRRMDAHRQRVVQAKLALPSFTLQQVLEVSANELRKASDALTAAKTGGTEPPLLDMRLLRGAQDVLDVGKWSLLDPQGPLWFRGYAQWEEAATMAQVVGLLDQLKLTRILVGHTVTTDHKVHARYGGRVVVMDTGMLRSVYEGTPSAVEVSGTLVTAVYPDGEERLTP